MTSVYRQLKTEDCNAKVAEHFSVHVLNILKDLEKEVKISETLFNRMKPTG